MHDGMSTMSTLSSHIDPSNPVYYGCKAVLVHNHNCISVFPNPLEHLVMLPEPCIMFTSPLDGCLPSYARFEKHAYQQIASKCQRGAVRACWTISKPCCSLKSAADSTRSLLPCKFGLPAISRIQAALLKLRQFQAGEQGVGQACKL